MHFPLGYVGAFALLAQQALAYPYSELPVYNVTGDWVDPDIYKRQDTDLKTPLRVLPLGASITWGTASSDKNGYRKALRDAMRFAGHPVSMVGSHRNGDMNDNDNEGWPGYIIDEVHEKAVPQYKVKPNLVLINAGTNDCVKHIDFIRQPQRMKNMVEDIFENIPEVTVILSGLLPNKATNACTKLMNNNYGKVVDDLAGQGRKIVFADTYNGYITEDDLSDGTHPTDFGYQKLASIWWLAFTKASQKGFITIPEDNGLPEDSTTSVCDKEYANGVGPTKIQRGSGWSDGDYVHDGREQGQLLKFYQDNAELTHKNVFFADLNGDGADDFIWYKDPENYPGNYEIWFNTQDQNNPFEDAENVNISLEDGCHPRGVRWGDVNADGLDDFICIGPQGNMYVTINRSQRTTSGQLSFERLSGEYFTHPPGRSQKHVRLGDIDGDGRLDYCAIADNGDISCWRNGWIEDRAKYWQFLGIIFTGKDKGNIDGVRLIDINGDHRSDWLYVNDDGSVDTYINNRGHDKSLKPDWRDAGRTHGGMHLEGTRPYIFFGRMTLSGKSDYMWLQYAPGNSEETYTKINWWRNYGTGGRVLKADNNHYCDMDGDGSDDYLAVSPIGEIQLYRNIHDPPNWGQDGVIFNQYWPHKNIRITDIDGDGKCDVVFLNRDGTVASWYKNQYSEDDGFSFDKMGTIDGLPPCSQRDGVGLFDLAVRFADLNGDGKADRLCLDEDGRTFAYLSTPKGYKNMNQVKTPEDRDRANLRFVDINGDKKADMVWLDKFGGDAEVWYNEKEEPAEGTDSSMIWRPAGKAYLLSARGETIHLVNLAGKGRADMIDVVPRYNTAEVSFTPECPGGGGDDGEISDPGLPALNGPSGFPQFQRFFAMGDSYSAGIGAGAHIKDDYDPEDKCARNSGAYSPWLHSNDPVLQSGQFDFISCSGDKTRHILSEAHYSRDTQLDILRAKVPSTQYAWGTLSIGGNDVGFSSIAKGCLIGLPGYDCEKSIAKADAMINGNGPEAEKFTNDLTAVYSGILDASQTQHFTLVVTGYASFFNEDTSRCDKETLSPWKIGPKLDKEKRSRLNRLAEQLNERIRGVTAQVDSEFPDKYIRFYDINPQFDTHRFCDVDEKGNERKEWKDSAWFLTAFGDDIHPNGEVIPLNDNVEGSFDLRTLDLSQCPGPDSDDGDPRADACDYARFVQENPDVIIEDEGTNADFITTFLEPAKAFHPKSIAHVETGHGITDKWMEQWGFFVPETPS